MAQSTTSISFHHCVQAVLNILLRVGAPYCIIHKSLIIFIRGCISRMNYIVVQGMGGAMP